jgi:hypothetical protein
MAKAKDKRTPPADELPSLWLRVLPVLLALIRALPAIVGAWEADRSR